MNEALKEVSIKGFQGDMIEVKFVKYLISKASMTLENITIWFDDDCLWTRACNAIESFDLAASTMPSGSVCTITVKPGQNYWEEIGGCWDDWITYLQSTSSCTASSSIM